MNFFEYRAQKYANQRTIADGAHTVTILEAREDDEMKFIVKLRFQSGEVLEKKFNYDPYKYGPFDALIDAALGRGATNFGLPDLIGKRIEIEVLNENRFTNIKRIRPVKLQDQSVDDFFEEEFEDIPAIGELS
ncbi:hypothetical protein ACTHPH_06560 [Paenibacillus pasadenensis]|uniref:hypothetical protein n=1 Tax=Paenibacillus TaxID=44249 RepID=UPI00048C888B|nr:hypothetical protein [Paenibacillus pasadenensis]